MSKLLYFIRLPGNILREILSDDDERLSSGRVMAVMAMTTACTLLLGQMFGLVDCDKSYDGTITVLVGAATGGKLVQKHLERK